MHILCQYVLQFLRLHNLGQYYTFLAWKITLSSGIVGAYKSEPQQLIL
jgi:hypothetical protein